MRRGSSRTGRFRSPFQLLLDRLDDRPQDLHAREALVVALDDRPGSRARRGLDEHVLDGLVVDVPLLAVAPVLVRELPGLERIRGARLEAAELLVLRDLDPELAHDRAVADQLALELVDFTIRALPLGLGAELLDALDEDASVPGAVEDAEPAARREPPPEAVEVVVRLVLALRRGDRVGDVAARVELLGD